MLSKANQYWPTDGMVEQVYAAIARHSGKIRSTDLDRAFGKPKQVRYAITQLTVRGRIKRIKGFGEGSGIEYFYIALC
jgi:hypothetical protein